MGPQAIIAVVLFAITALGGWTARGWFEGARDAVALEAAQKATDAMLVRESAIAEAVEKRLGELQANQTIIDRGVIREIQNPVYRNVCLPDTALGLLNAAARGTAPDPAKLTGEVSKGAPAAQ